MAKKYAFGKNSRLTHRAGAPKHNPKALRLATVLFTKRQQKCMSTIAIRDNCHQYTKAKHDMQLFECCAVLSFAKLVTATQTCFRCAAKNQ